jgi:hypothetical protein
MMLDTVVQFVVHIRICNDVLDNVRKWKVSQYEKAREMRALE